MSSSRVAAYRQDAQAATARARQYGAPWSPQDDEQLAHGPGTVLDRAVALGRTYYACAARLAYLREQGVDTD